MPKSYLLQWWLCKIGRHLGSWKHISIMLSHWFSAIGHTPLTSWLCMPNPGWVSSLGPWLILVGSKLTLWGALQNGSGKRWRVENRAVVIDVCHLDFKGSRILHQLVVPIKHLGCQTVQTLLLSVQSSGDKQISFIIHNEDVASSLPFNFEILHIQYLAWLQLWKKKMRNGKVWMRVMSISSLLD